MRLVPAFCLVVSAAAGAGADGGESDPEPLEATVVLEAPRIRSGAPFVLTVTLARRGGAAAGVLAGRLGFRFVHVGAVVGRWRSAELGLASGEQSYRLLMPPLAEGGYSSEVVVEATFTTADGEIDLGTHRLPSASAAERVFAVLASGDPAATRTAVAKALGFGKLDPALGQHPLLSTAVSHVAPRDLPERALEHCCHDVVLLVGNGLAALSAAQLDALERWLRAGGSLCVVAPRGLGAAHLDFLDRVAGAEADRPLFRPDGAGSVVVEPAALDEGIVELHVDLGRLVVAPGPPPAAAELESPRWRAAFGFLWKVRARPLDRLRRYGRLQREAAALPEVDTLRLGTGGRLLGSFLPAGFRLLPFGTVFLILTAFFLAVGPLERFVLGRARRRLTWIVVPALSIAFTLLTVFLAGRVMGGVDVASSITVHDVGPGGRLLRTNRYELAFSSEHRETTTDVAGGLFAAVSRAEYDLRGRAAFDARLEDPPLLEGQLPGRFRVEQRIPRWSPRLLRTLSIGGAAGEEEALPQLDWDAVGPALFRREGGRDRVRELLCDEAFEGAIFLLNGVRRLRVFAKAGEAERDVVLRASARPQEKLFALVSSISPTGGGSFEDLAVLDVNDPAEWLLVVTIPRGDDLLVLRRLYREEDR